MKTFKNFRILIILLSLATAYSCADKAGGGQMNAAGQVKEYQVMEIKKDSTTLFKEYPTTLEGQQTVEIRPKIAGYIEAILVDEGDFVRKGQTLFRINANDVQATVRSAEAQVKVAEAQVENAKINLEKTKPLAEKEIVSSYNLKAAEVALLSSEAQLSQAKANLANAKANLEYAIITSPTDGIIGTFPYRVGSLVSSASTLPLTSIANTTTMFAYFSMNEKEFLNLTRDMQGSKLQEKLAHLPKVSLVMADKSVYGIPGKVETASGLVDAQTGAVNLRATIPNPDQILSSGSSGKIRLPQHIKDAILIPQKAAYELQGKHFVYLVGEDNKVKSIEVEAMAGNLKDSYVVTSGLKEGDHIVVEGISTLRNDTPIKPKLVSAGQQAQPDTTVNQGNN